MNTITLHKNQYEQILDTQEKLKSDLTRLEKIVSFVAQDELNSKYIKKLFKIEKGLSLGSGVKFKNKSQIKKFFNSF